MRKVLASVVFAALLCASHEALAQVKAYSVAISADRVGIEVQVVGHSSATIHVRNGEMARMTPPGSDAIGLTPVIRGGAVDLVVMQVLVDPASGNEGLRQFAKYNLKRGVQVRIGEVDPALDATWVETQAPAASSPEPAGPCTNCCVICDDSLYCGCLVITECGRCCCPAICICPFEPEPATPSAGAERTTGGCGRQRA